MPMVFVIHTVPAGGSNKVPQLVENNIEHKQLSNKRKLIDNFGDEEDQGFKKLKTVPSLHYSSSLLDNSTGSQLETPLPLDWQRCLDIQSGKVHFYNTKSETRTSRDPREGTSRRSPSHMSLDLELNLPYVSPDDEPEPNQLLADLNIVVDHDTQSYDLFRIKKDTENKNMINKMNNPVAAISSSSSSAPSWLAFEGDEKSDMVATVCKRCFMLVMLCKASPACPNCKFMHSPDQSVPYLFKIKDLHPTSVLNFPATYSYQ